MRRWVSVLAEAFDAAAAGRAATVPEALEVIGLVLVSVAGDNELVYVGWGLGEHLGSSLRMGPAYRPAPQAVAAHRATVHVLDLTRADHHHLEALSRRVPRPAAAPARRATTSRTTPPASWCAP